MLEELNVGKKIKRLRKLKNMNAKDLAQNAGISYGMLSLLENGSTQGSVSKTKTMKVFVLLHHLPLKYSKLVPKLNQFPHVQLFQALLKLLLQPIVIII
jgi:transcriptional regulator with XRE-family HTH domain